LLHSPKNRSITVAARSLETAPRPKQSRARK
jgi:hypothetical protein